ncbi:MAG: ABC transporter permease subunit [Acidobacteriota bacterium]|jgi:phosphate transport system permease protein
MRRPTEVLFWTGAGLCALAACAVLAGIVGAIVARGLPALSWSFLVQDAREAGAAGGILYQLAGTVILIVTALAVAAPPAVALALLRTVYLAERGARRLRLALYAWNGVPSVVFGVFGLVVFVRGFGWGKSWLAGGIVLGLMILPTLTVALAERMAAVPEESLEAAYGLGLTRSRVVLAVILPQSAGGFLSGALLGLARAAGETAPILFTAAVFSGATLPSGVRESPILALPYHIFVLAQDSLDPGAVSRLWAAAFVLLALVFGLSLLSLPARLRSHAEARDA